MRLRRIVTKIAVTVAAQKVANAAGKCAGTRPVPPLTGSGAAHLLCCVQALPSAVDGVGAPLHVRLALPGTCGRVKGAASSGIPNLHTRISRGAKVVSSRPGRPCCQSWPWPEGGLLSLA